MRRAESRKRNRTDTPSNLFGGVGSSSAYGSANMGGDGGGTSGSGGLSMSGNFSTNCCWKNKEVVIEGIDRAVWRAFVSATTGRVYFLHLPTNLKQEVVPPGFADNDDYTGPFASLPAAQEQEAFSMDTLEASVQSRVPLAHWACPRRLLWVGSLLWMHRKRLNLIFKRVIPVMVMEQLLVLVEVGGVVGGHNSPVRRWVTV